MSAPIFAPMKWASLKSNPARRAIIRAPEKLAPLNLGASAGEISRPDETTRPKRLAFDKSALVKFALMIQARSSRAPERLAPEKSALSSLAPKRFAPARLARLKSRLLRSRFSRDLPDKSAGVSGPADANICRTCVAVRSAARAEEIPRTSNTHPRFADLIKGLLARPAR